MSSVDDSAPFPHVQKGPEPAVSSQLLVPAAEPGETGEQGPRHAERHLPQQRHHEVHADQRGLHATAEEGEREETLKHDMI